MHESGQTRGNFSQRLTGARNEANRWVYTIFRLENLQWQTRAREQKMSSGDIK